MSKITEADLQVLREQIQAALAPLIREKGITLKLGRRCECDPENGNFAFTLEGTVKGGLTKEEAAYEQLRALHPKLPTLHTKVVIKKKIFEIVGANSTLSKVIATSNGQRYDVAISAVEENASTRTKG